jgi:hypothetical protein
MMIPIADAPRHDGEPLILIRYGWIGADGCTRLQGDDDGPGTHYGLWWAAKGRWSDKHDRWVVTGWEDAEINRPSHYIPIPKMLP